MKISYKERKAFADWLKGKQNELGFKSGDLAEYTGVCLVTAGKYISGESYPSSEKTKEKIYEFIESLSVIDNFRRMENEEFSELLDRLIKLFKISQTEIAEATGIKQPYISDYVNGNYERHITTKNQYDILSFFLYRAHLGTGVFLPEYVEAGQDLMKRLGVTVRCNYPTRVVEYFVEKIDGKYYLYDDGESEQYMDRVEMKNHESLQYFSALPLEVKKIIKETNEAFFIYTDISDMSIGLQIWSFLDDIKFLNNFDDKVVPEILGNILAKKLCPGEENKKFRTICAFFKLMSVADRMPELLAKSTRRCAEDDKLDLWYRAKLSSQFAAEAFSEIELRARLEMSAMDWYYVMLAYVNSGDEEKILRINDTADYIHKLYEI